MSSPAHPLQSHPLIFQVDRTCLIHSLSSKYLSIPTGSAGFLHSPSLAIWIVARGLGARTSIHIHRPGPEKNLTAPVDMDICRLLVAISHYLSKTYFERDVD